MSVYLRLPSYEKRPVIKAIVFYGRRYSVRLLNCYLERNLLRGGGLLSEVQPVAQQHAAEPCLRRIRMFCCATRDLHLQLGHLSVLQLTAANLLSEQVCDASE